ncbi:leucine-rich repeat-containing protein 34 [Drosophila miranda]|uniref:leucine-rich repeat-containing protein 34 n=1 Tax=Drosophila miranda TaxID=7229 RepID=UPI0007E7B1C9|nr:leucine-rich repeat-containing protein 34 [Drosophila miranda]
MMCDVGLPCVYDPGQCTAPVTVKPRLFTIMLLHCWQREYDKRPYRKFQFRRLDFEERIGRRYHCIRDFRIIVNFLLRRSLLEVSIWSVVVSNWDAKLLQEFALSLIRVWKIELKLMQLPTEFFVMLRLNAAKMEVVELSLEGTPLSDQNVRMLREFLLVNKTLRTLNVSHCSLTQYNFALIADGVHKSGVRSLNASRLLGLKLSLDTEKMVSIIGSLLMQNHLVVLTLQHCEFTAQDMQPISEYLYRSKCALRELNLASNLIAADGTLFLMRGIAQGGSLELLDISCNSIGTHGGEWIAMYLSSCRMLQHLYLNYNDIGESGINLILLTIKKESKMKRLNLYGNSFDARSAMIVRRLLDAEVLFHEEIDISYTYDEALQDYRIVPWR